MMHKRLILEKGPFNNYVDKMRGVKKWQNSVHVVVEWPQMGNSHMDFVCEFTLMCDGNDENLHAAYPLFWRVQIAKLKKKLAH